MLGEPGREQLRQRKGKEVTMEVNREEMTQEKWDEMREMVKRLVCADCGADLQIHTVAERGVIRVGCLDQSHHGWVERETWTQAFRRGEEIHPAIKDRIEKRMLPGGYSLEVALALVKTRFPRADMDDPSAALFIMDCMRLDLDPLLGEIVPVTFKVTDKETKVVRKVVQPVLTEDGWLSLAARACPDRWIGPPRTYRLEDYLRTLEENKVKSPDEIKGLSREIRKDACGDEDAYYWVAWGKVKVDDTITETAASPGWLKQKEYKKAQESATPAGELPGNQARVRSIKRWVRENFPEAKAKMKAITAEWLARGKDIEGVQQIIEAEYHIVTEIEPPKGDDKTGESSPGGEGKPGATALSSPKQETKPPEASAPPKRDPNTIKTFDDLYRACRDDFRLNEKEVLRELGVTSQEDLSQLPRELYLQILAVRR